MAQAAKAHAQYLIVGLAIGGLWLLNRDKSLLYHAVQMLAVMSVLTGLQIWFRRRPGRPAHGTRTSTGPPRGQPRHACHRG
jgi:hypothetical protein